MRWFTGLVIFLTFTDASATECDTPGPGWIFCEDFEAGNGNWGIWYPQSVWVECNGCTGNTTNPDKIRLSGDSDHVFDGNYGLVTAEGGSTGALIFRVFENYPGTVANPSLGNKPNAGSALGGYEKLYFRMRTRLHPQHHRNHHFVEIHGTRLGANNYWDSAGNAGCRPNGTRYAGTTLDIDSDHELFFYTYTPDMSCDSGSNCNRYNNAQNVCNQCASKEMPCSNGLECCWGNHYRPSTPDVIPRGEWVCLEFMMELNTPGVADGEMAYWINDSLGHREQGMYWRDIADLKLNKAWLKNYVSNTEAGRHYEIAFDNVIVSTQRIGCDSSVPDPDPDPSPDPDPDPSPDPQPDAEPDPQPDPQPDAEPDPQPDPEPEVDPEPDPIDPWLRDPVDQNDTETEEPLATAGSCSVAGMWWWLLLGWRRRLLR